MAEAPSKTPDLTNEERRTIIWGVNAWLGMNSDLSPQTRDAIFNLALDDVLPDVSESEISYSLGIIAGMMDDRRKKNV